MKYTQEGDRVTLEMTRDDFARLFLMMGAAVGTASNNDPDLAAEWLEFVNRLNEGNPNFVRDSGPGESVMKFKRLLRRNQRALFVGAVAVSTFFLGRMTATFKWSDVIITLLYIANACLWFLPLWREEKREKQEFLSMMRSIDAEMMRNLDAEIRRRGGMDSEEPRV